MARSPPCGRLLFEDGEASVLSPGSEPCLVSSEHECVGVESSDTNGVDSSLQSWSLSEEDRGSVPRSLSLSFVSFSRLVAGTAGETVVPGCPGSGENSSTRRGFDRWDFNVRENTGFRGIALLFFGELSSADFDLKGGRGERGGETRREVGRERALFVLWFWFKCPCEQVDLVLRWEAMLRWELERWRRDAESWELSSSEVESVGSSPMTGCQWSSGEDCRKTYSVSPGPKTPRDKPRCGPPKTFLSS